MARSIYRREIPTSMVTGMQPLPAKGQMSFAYLKNEKEVRIFTRDVIKSEWLMHSWGLDMAEYVDCIETPHSPFLSDIVVLDMPRLYPVRAERNRRIIKDICKAFHKVGPKWGARQTDRLQQMINDNLRGASCKLVQHLLGFCLNYNNNMFCLDICPCQFMETKRGRLIFLDPVVSADLLKHLYRRRTV